MALSKVELVSTWLEHIIETCDLQYCNSTKINYR